MSRNLPKHILEKNTKVFNTLPRMSIIAIFEYAFSKIDDFPEFILISRPFKNVIEKSLIAWRRIRYLIIEQPKEKVR